MSEEKKYNVIKNTGFIVQNINSPQTNCTSTVIAQQTNYLPDAGSIPGFSAVPGALCSSSHPLISDGPCLSTPNVHRPIPLKLIGNPESHGLALIINIYKYQTDKRKGSHLDYNKLIETLTAFNLGIFVPDSDSYLKDELISHAHIAEWITEFQTKFKSGCAKFSFVFVMGHGVEPNRLVDSYGIDQSLDTSVFNRFNNANFPTMIDKPKLFLMNCCRGEEKTPPVTVKHDGIELDKPSRTVPTVSDILLAWSTTPGAYSLRNPEAGSIFVKTFCVRMEEYYKYLNEEGRGTDHEFTKVILDEVSNKLEEYRTTCKGIGELTQTVNVETRAFGYFSWLLDDCVYFKNGKPQPF